MTTGESCELWQQVSLVSYDNRWVLWVMTTGEYCELWQQVNLVSYDNRWVLWVMTTGKYCELWQQVSIVSYDNRWGLWIMTRSESCALWQQVSLVRYDNKIVLWVITGWKFSFQSTEAFLNVHWMLTECSCPRAGSNPGILFLVFFLNRYGTSTPRCFISDTG